MKNLMTTLAIGLLGFALAATSASAALITFDDLVTGQTSYGFDGDGDSINDVMFSTTDPLGFNTVGPGANMTYIDEPGLEGTSLLNPDLRVDFLVGAVSSVSFGFSLDSFTEDDHASFALYNGAGVLIAAGSEMGLYTLPDGVNRSNFPEGRISLSFAGIAAYGLFDFTSDYGRYIIDNLEGTFGSTEPIPEPSAPLLFGAGLLVVGRALRRRAA